jgi:hypothetical protein
MHHAGQRWFIGEPGQEFTVAVTRINPSTKIFRVGCLDLKEQGIATCRAGRDSRAWQLDPGCQSKVGLSLMSQEAVVACVTAWTARKTAVLRSSVVHLMHEPACVLQAHLDIDDKDSGYGRLFFGGDLEIGGSAARVFEGWLQKTGGLAGTAQVTMPLHSAGHSRASLMSSAPDDCVT